MKITKFLLLLIIPVFLVVFDGCSKKDDETTDPIVETVSPTNANALSGIIVIPGANRMNGSMPASSLFGTAGIPLITGAPTTMISSNGSTVLVPFSFQSTNSISGIFLQVVGASSYFQIPYAGNLTTGGNISIPITIPTNVTEGVFHVTFSVFDNASTSLVSERATTEISVQRLGTGALQISLSWNTDETDLDLWVTDPSGFRIYYGDTLSTTGGKLDRDDTDGYGPENIFWKDSAPDGEYKVQVDYWDDEGGQKTDFVVTVSNGITSKQWQDSFNSDYDPTKLVVTITKSGNNLTFRKMAFLPGLID
ncbi:MAG: hypothetical protein V1720_03285 [bacterium]